MLITLPPVDKEASIDEAVEDIELQTSLPFSTEEVNTSTPLQTSVPQDTAKVTVDLKRVRIPDIQSEENDYTLDSGSKKRFRPAENISAGATEKTTHSILYSKHSTLKEFASLWQTKIMLIRSLRAPIYKEKDLVQLLLKIHKTHSRIQCHHLSLYLIPVAKAMRKHSIVEILNKWICN
ncbi:hypothetical protein BDF20DRAFT_912545 [Mycotypha africana]|uniref:uncharacterized protein n=1 Tax=Mycotypha africana TaxID=64632 RepID=UPI002300107E|nr:uncharacterized protein BDF20DRAFT_912545 [Mycotypha africana]KAI8982376.1 hypothetical protein BDF20DRAFT_912545 [Mycotypha africana]